MFLWIDLRWPCYDHINNNKTDNSLENLHAISQSQNTKKGRARTCMSVGKRPVQSFDTTSHEEKVFQSMNAAGKYFYICMPSVRFVAENITKSVLSKKNGHRVQFTYITSKGDKSSVDIQ